MTIPVAKRAEIFRLHKLGESQRAIAERLGVSRAAVKNYIRDPFPSLEDSSEPIDRGQVIPGEFLGEFDRKVNLILDRLLDRYQEIAADPDTSNRDLISLGRLIQSWSPQTPSDSPTSNTTNGLSEVDLDARWEERKRQAEILREKI
ncbi:helix-turn-helix domain-containing protein [Oscillatoriales cyanobacterium LEGE 11467]|uniref:Helix-turn-helix domain-containing protein n=1 Tax=Zarconia navalis LEGE 11467 TaxID=1828826 RepID=A0A928VYX2_9CYAN|nr:helix-turn-helix domain-containing protein [Zarconia navalis]MBE9041823.1 helix-turn-helix domain-containing protein [Zarconia navalis LEGE 11467]